MARKIIGVIIRDGDAGAGKCTTENIQAYMRQYADMRIEKSGAWPSPVNINHDNYDRSPLTNNL